MIEALRGPGARFALAHLLQLPSLGMVAFLPPGWPWCAAGLWASLVAAASTDSGWRWRNRLLALETVAWLTLAVCAIP